MLEAIEISCVTPAPGWLLATVGQLGVAYDGHRVVVALATERDSDTVHRGPDEGIELTAAPLEAVPQRAPAMTVIASPPPVLAPPMADPAPPPSADPAPSPSPSVALVRVPRLDLALAPRMPRVSRIQIIELTPRERQVIEACAEGHGNKEIAAYLGISLHTVKFHVDRIIRKLGARNRTHAAVMCVRRELAKGQA